MNWANALGKLITSSERGHVDDSEFDSTLLRFLQDFSSKLLKVAANEARLVQESALQFLEKLEKFLANPRESPLRSDYGNNNGE